MTFGSSDYARLGAPGSYVNVLDFSTVRDLVDYLRRIHESDEKFADHLLLRRYYEIDTYNQIKQPLCELCARLHSFSEPPKSYSNLTHWWLDDSRCRTLRSIRGWDGEIDVGPWEA